MKHSYGKIICFQNFPFGKGLVREEFLKQPVGNSNTYDLKLENAMSGEFNVMIVQTLET